MTSKNVKDDVKDLLALLQSSTSQPTSSATQTRNAGPSRSSGYSPTRPGFSPSRQGYGRADPPSVIPTKRQLDDLLASLSGPTQDTAPRIPTSYPSTSTGKSRALIDPFGPVGSVHTHQTTFDPQAPSSFSQIYDGSAVKSPTRTKSASGTRIQRDRDKYERPEYAEMGFAKALPVISELLEDVEFKREPRKMKADQDALERRLWAKQERVKAEHEQVVQAEKDIARISQKPIPRAKQQQFADMLASDLSEFYLNTCLPSVDGLALRQREKLQELGVPGLGGDMKDEKARERVKRIMDLLEAAMDE